MGILSGKKAGPAWRTKWSGYERILEDNAFPGDTVDVGSSNHWMTHTAELIPPQVVHKNEDKVRARRAVNCRGCLPLDRNRRSEQSEQVSSRRRHRSVS